MWEAKKPDSKDYYLFGKKRDILLFYFSPVFLILTFVEIYLIYFLDLAKFKIGIWPSILANFVFFNTLHVPLTFLMLAFFPHLRIWTRTDNTSGPFKFWTNTAIIYTLFFLIVFCGGAFVLKYSYGIFIFSLAFLIRLSLGVIHNLGQIFGLSAILNENYLKNHPELTAQLRKLIKIEKCLIGLIAFLILTTAVKFFYLNNTKYNFFDAKALDTLTLTCATTILIFSIFLVTYRYPKTLRRKKAVYYLRLLFWPFFLISTTASFAHRANHGIEYVCMSTHVVEKMNPTKKKLIVFLSLYILIILIWTILFLCELYFPKNKLYSIFFIKPFSLWHFLLSLRWAVDLTHYWTDGVIFKMRNKNTRTLIGPLLLKD